MKEIIKSRPGFSAPAPAPAQIANGIVADEANFVDWSNIEEVENAIKTLSDVDIRGSEIARVRELVDIKNQVKKLMALA
jgi:hypothetical protein